MRKLIASLLAASAMVMFARPVDAANSEKPPAQAADPADALTDLVNGIDLINSGPGAVKVDGARGTAFSTVIGARLTMGEDVDLRVLDTLVTATTDHRRLQAPKNFARGEASVGSVYWDDLVEEGTEPHHIPDRMRGESYSGENTQNYCLDPAPEACVGEQLVKFPPKALYEGGVDWDDVQRQVLALVGLVDGVRDESETWARETTPEGLPVLTVSPSGASAKIPLLSGNQSVSMDTGSLVNALVRPASIQTHMKPSGSFATVESAVKSAELLKGLSTLRDVGAGSQVAHVTEQVASAETRLLKIDHMGVLEMDALLRLLGVDAEMLPPGVLAELADALGINVARLATQFQGVTGWDSVQALVGIVRDVRTAGLSAVTGAACGLLTSDLRSAANNLGLVPPPCPGATPLDLQKFADAAVKLYTDLVNAVMKAVADESLLSVSKLEASAAASASVTGSEKDITAATFGGIQSIVAGGLVLDGVDLQKDAATWNATEADVNTVLNSVLGVLGDEFKDVVRVRLVPEVKERGRVIDRTYLQSEARLTLMKVFIDLPGPDAVQAALTNLIDAAHRTVTNVTGPLPVPGSGGGGGLGGGLLGRADVTDPITISLGEVRAVAEHTKPGVTLPSECESGAKVCDASKLLTRNWNPQSGFGPGSGTGTDLPRTGGPAGTVPVTVAAGLGAGAYIVRRWLGTRA